MLTLFRYNFISLYRTTAQWTVHYGYVDIKVTMGRPRRLEVSLDDRCYLDSDLGFNINIQIIGKHQFRCLLE